MWTFLVLISLIQFSVFYWFLQRSRKKINRLVELDEARQTMGILTREFNQQADLNIGILEDRIEQAEALVKKLDTIALKSEENQKPSEVKETPTVESHSHKQSQISLEEQNALLASEEKAKPKPKPKVSKSRSSERKAKAAPVLPLGQQLKDRFETMSFDEKVTFYAHQGLSEKKIAFMLSCSLLEVQMVFRKRKQMSL